jgi:glutaminyl-tRNA synthetase
LTRGGESPPDGRKVKATLHWVSAADAVPAEVRLYNPLFTIPEPEPGNFAGSLNPDSCETVTAMLEPSIVASNELGPVQFERLGYFYRDSDSAPGRPVFNRVVGLKDSYARQVAR